VSNGYTSKCSGLNHPLQLFDIRAIWIAKLRGGLDQYGAERFSTHLCHNQEKCGTERVNTWNINV